MGRRVEGGRTWSSVCAARDGSVLCRAWDSVNRSLVARHTPNPLHPTPRHTHTHTTFSPPPARRRAAAPLVFPAHPVHGPHCAAPCCAAVHERTAAVHCTALRQRSAAQHAAAARDGPAPGPPHEWRASGRSEACGHATSTCATGAQTATLLHQECNGRCRRSTAQAPCHAAARQRTAQR
jgi:hypothetical protein